MAAGNGMIRPFWAVALGISGAVLAAVGPLLFPNHKLLMFWIGIAIGVSGVIAFFLDAATTRHRDRSGGSTSFVSRRGNITVGEIDSSADTVADVKGGRHWFGRVRHTPARTPRRQAAKPRSRKGRDR